MSFDDLQKTWGGQTFAPDAAQQAAVLERIRTRERAFRRVVLAGVVRDAAMLVVLVMIVAAAWQGFHLPAWLAVVTAGIFAAGTAVMLRLSKPLTGELLSGPGALAEQVGRDSMRFRRMMLWGNTRELLACIAVVWCFAINALSTGDHPGLRWASVAFVALSAGVWVTHMVRLERRRPAADETIVGELAVTIYYARTQLRLMGNLVWYFAPLVGAVACLKLIRVVDGTAPLRSQMIPVAAIAIVLWLTTKANRRLAESRLRPRAEFLERLRDQLSGTAAKP